MSDPALELVEDNPIGEPWNLKAKDVAEYLGISPDEVYRIDPEELPYLSKGRRRRYRVSDVRALADRYVVDGGG